MHRMEVIGALSIPTVTERNLYHLGKRSMDVVLGVVALFIVLPAMLVIALLIKLDSQGPVLFRQVRLGRSGQPFTLYKFRTMYHGADDQPHRDYVERLIRCELMGTGTSRGSNEDADACYKLTGDPRVTRIGQFLRRTSIDEVPQLLNVMKGEMSLVGPRPPLPYEVRQYQDWHKKRLAALPGVTGIWQVNGRSRVPFEEMVRMDLDYISRQSLWLDIKILLLTIPAVLLGTGAK